MGSREIDSFLKQSFNLSIKPVGDTESFQMTETQGVCFVLNGRSQKREKGLKVYRREEEEEVASRTHAHGEWLSLPLKEGRIDNGQMNNGLQ